MGGVRAAGTGIVFRLGTGAHAEPGAVGAGDPRGAVRARAQAGAAGRDGAGGQPACAPLRVPRRQDGGTGGSTRGHVLRRSDGPGYGEACHDAHGRTRRDGDGHGAAAAGRRDGPAAEGRGG